MFNIENIMETLIQLSEEKYDALDNMYKLTKEQTEAISIEDIDKLNELIHKKQLEINLAQSLDKRIEKILNDIKIMYNINDLSELNVCNEEVKRVQYIFAMTMNKGRQIYELEINNKSELVNSKNHIEEKMRNLKSGKKAVSGYGYNIQAPVYFDKKSGKK